MIGAIVLIVVMLVMFPLLLAGGMALAGLLGWSLKAEAEATHPGSELIDLNR